MRHILVVVASSLAAWVVVSALAGLAFGRWFLWMKEHGSDE